MDIKKAISFIFKPFLYAMGRIPSPSIYGFALLLAVKLSDENLVSFITKHQNINSISKNLSIDILKNALFYSNGKGELKMSSINLSDKEKKLNKNIMSKLISNNDGIYFSVSSNNFSLLLEELSFVGAKKDIVNLYTKNKSVMSHPRSFPFLTYHAKPSIVIDIYNLIKKDGMGSDLVSLYYKDGSRTTYRTKLFSFCVVSAPDEVLIDMLKSMDSLDKSDLLNINSRKNISKDLLVSIMKKAVSDIDLAKQFLRIKDDLSNKDYYDDFKRLHPMAFTSLLEAKALIEKEVITSSLFNTPSNLDIRSSNSSSENNKTQDCNGEHLLGDIKPSVKTRKKRSFKI